MLNNPQTEQPFVATSATAATRPEPLWDKKIEMRDFPLQALGVLEAPVRAIAELSNAHIVTCANSVLAVAALATQGLADVEYPNGATTPLSLYFLTIAESGDGKTACDRFATEPVREREYKMGALSEDKDEDGKTSDTHIPYIIVCHEPTFEGFYKLLQVGHPSQGIFSDEGGQFVGGYSMRETRESLVSNLSSLWGGSSLKRVRVGEKPSVVNGKRVSLHLMLQPIVAQKLLSDQYIKGQGFLARCLITRPPSMAGKRLFKMPTEEAIRTKDAYNEKILNILNMPLNITHPGRCLKPRSIRLTPKQVERWTDFQNKVEVARAEGEVCYPVREFTAKLGEHALRLAGVLTLVSNPEATEITDSVLEDAFNLSGFYLNEALRLEEEESIPPEVQDAIKLLNWLQAKQHFSFNIRIIANAGPNAMRKSQDRIKKALGVMISKGWVTEPTKQGEPYRLYHA